MGLNTFSILEWSHFPGGSAAPIGALRIHRECRFTPLGERVQNLAEVPTILPPLILPHTPTLFRPHAVFGRKLLLSLVLCSS